MAHNNIATISRADFEDREPSPTSPPGQRSTPPPPFSLQRKLKLLDLSNCSISMLQGNPFDGLMKLEVLLLSNNRITNAGIENALKSHHPRLFSLSLSGNLLESVPNLPNTTRKLYISHNHITNLSRANMKGMPLLETFHIQENPLKGFPLVDDTFADCPMVNGLNFDHTELTQLPNITYMPKLVSLTVNHARLTHLPDDICLQLLRDFNPGVEGERNHICSSAVVFIHEGPGSQP